MTNYYSHTLAHQPRLQACHKAGSLVEPGKLILPVNATGNWMYGHTALRAATIKGLVSLENYEASMNYFPLRWKASVEAVPELPNGPISPDFAWWPWKTPGKRVLVDYVFAVGNVYNQEGEHFRKLGECLKNDYKEIYTEADCYLYQLKQQ